MTSSIYTILDLVGHTDFHVGLLGGTAAWLITSLLCPNRRGWGIAVSLATVIGVNLAVYRRLSALLGVVLLCVGGWMLGRENDTSEITRTPWVVIVGGALAMAYRSGIPNVPWILFVSPAVIVGMGWLLSSWSEHPNRRLLGPLFLITTFGIWTTVPDTDAARVLLGASAALAAATVSKKGLGLSTAGAYGLAGILVWISAAGGAERHGSIIGAWACAGLLLILPLTPSRGHVLPDWLILAVHAVVVFVAARVLGMLDAAAPVVVGVTALAGLSHIVLRSYAPRSDRAAQAGEP